MLKPKRIIETPNKDYKPLARIEAKLTTYSKDIIAKSLDTGLIEVAKKDESWPGQRVEYRQATFVNGMLEKLFSLPGGLKVLKDNLAKPAI